MLRGITTRQFMEWRAYADLEPFDEERADYRAASIVQAVRNSLRKKGQRALSLKDCLLPFGKEPEKVKTVEERRAEIAQTLDWMTILFADAKDEKKSRAQRLR